MDFDDSLWVEKYRPKKISDIVSQDETISIMNKITNNGNLPHLLFYGPPGVGKTTTALALSKQLFKNNFNDRILELNASDDRGIEIVRKKIKAFASLSINSDKNEKLPPFKIIILDEADNMTHDAQNALRRIIESYTNITRFILICNYLSCIIDPINSRCCKFKFNSINNNKIKEFMINICKKENYEISNELIEKIIFHSNGDMRRAIMLLQTSYIIHDKNINFKKIEELSGYIPDIYLNEIMLSCYNKDFTKSSKIIKDVLHNGYTANQFLLQLSNLLNNSNFPFIKNESTSNILMGISKIDYRISNGSNQYIQLLHLIGIIINNIK